MRNFVEWKEKEAVSKLLSLVHTGLVTGIATGIMIYLLIDVATKYTENIIIHIVCCTILGVMLGFFIWSLYKDYKKEIQRAIRPLMWDIQILHDRNERLTKEIEDSGFSTTFDEIVKEVVDEDEVEFVGEENRNDETDVH